MSLLKVSTCFFIARANSATTRACLGLAPLFEKRRGGGRGVMLVAG